MNGKAWVAVCLAAPLHMALAGPSNGQTPQSGWDQPNSAIAGDFRVVQIATTDPEGLMAAWEKPALEVKLETSMGAKRNQPIVTFIVFGGCRADPAGNCNVTADFEVIDPAGKSYNRSPGVNVWVGYPAPQSNVFQLSASGLGIRFEDQDPLGNYIVKAAITDQVSGVTLKTQQQLTAMSDAEH